MRILCDNCMKKPASVMCCADEAALCEDCDKSIHFANKLSIKHQRLALIPPSADTVMCDMCTEKTGLFFCTQDRAVLCRDCDVQIHCGENKYVGTHTRFIIPGARVGLEALPNGEAAPVSSDAVSVDSGQSIGTGVADVRRPAPAPVPPQFNDANEVCRIPPQPLVGDAGWVLGLPTTVNSMTYPTPQLAPSVPSYASRPMGMVNPPATANRINGNGLGGGIVSGVVGQGNDNGNGNIEKQYSMDFLEPFRVEEYLGIPHLSGYQLGDVASSKADKMLDGQYDWLDWSLVDELRVVEDTFHQVPSLTGATGIPSGRMGRPQVTLKGKGKQEPKLADYEDGFVVPDMGYHSSPASPPLVKRRRQ